MAVFQYLDPGERGENISYWRSTNDNNSDYSEDELLKKRVELDLKGPLINFLWSCAD